jgi:hypothetical protein
MSEESSSGPVPPYVSWTTVSNKIAEMEAKGIPARIDASYLVGMAGGTQNQFKQALRSLGLIDETDRVTSTLIELVQNPDGRPALVGQLLKDRYPPLVELDGNATPGQLDEVLAGYGLGKETRRKAASFFVAAATYAGLPISPHIKPPRTGGARRPSGGARRSTSRKAGANGAGDASTVPDALPPGAARHTLELRSGGTVTVAVSMNIFQMSRSDREFVLGLVDALQDYASKSDSPVGQAGARDSETEEESP